MTKRIRHFYRALSVCAMFGLQVTSVSAGEYGQWTMPAKDYQSTRFSGLAQITARNAARLHPVWTFSTGVLAGHEGQPLVVNDTMFVVTPWPNLRSDLTNAPAGLGRSGQLRLSDL